MDPAKSKSCLRGVREARCSGFFYPQLMPLKKSLIVTASIVSPSTSPPVTSGSSQRSSSSTVMPVITLVVIPPAPTVACTRVCPMSVPRLQTIGLFAPTSLVARTPMNISSSANESAAPNRKMEQMPTCPSGHGTCAA
eukprot:scaffold75408_cov65-Phaeocystis_antarctica.AAC.4